MAHYRTSVEALQRCLSAMALALPRVHHELVIFNDRLGQVAVGAGERELARQAFARAWECSCAASGAASPATRRVKGLAERVPADLAELRRRHQEG